MTKRKLLRISMSRREQLRGWAYLILQLALLPRLIHAVLFILWPGIDATTVNLTMFGINGVVTALLFLRFWKRTFAAVPDTGMNALWKAAVALTVCKLGIWALNWLLYLIAPEYFSMTVIGPALLNPNDQNVENMVAAQPPLMSIATVLLVPFAEEALHRGAVFGSIYPRKPLAAYILSVTLFALTHVLAYVGSCEIPHLLLCAAQYILPGLCLCFLYANTGMILAPIIMHMLFNAMGILSVR